jgi:acetaldehyde dehydrogenase
MSAQESRIKAAILGTGNIGSDLMFKIVRDPGQLDLALFAGIDAASEGIQRAKALGVKTATDGVDSILNDAEIKIVFDATSAKAHLKNAPKLEQAGKFVVDMTPAAIGPYCSPCVNLTEHLQAHNVNLITCGGQATIPLVHAVSRVTPIEYAEIVSTVGSASAGPGTRQNIDEFTVTTARGLEVLGGATRAKAIIILNPAEPPILMRNTIYILPEGPFDEGEVTASIENRIEEVQAYVPGYRLKGTPVYDTILVEGQERPSITLLLEIKGAGDFLPEYAGNLDIMTASAWQVGQKLAESFQAAV